MPDAGEPHIEPGRPWEVIAGAAAGSDAALIILASRRLAGLRALGGATGVTLAGALVVVGLLSTPLTMVEVERFAGVKLLLLLPPVSRVIVPPLLLAEPVVPLKLASNPSV